MTTEKQSKLEIKVGAFRQAIAEARKNPLIEYLDDYETWIADNVEKGNLEGARRHAALLVTYYVDDNPYRPDEEQKIEDVKDKIPKLYELMDAGRKMYNIGILAKDIASIISN